ncbi:hypothetical protein F2Q70_00025191 [Brassica cretica]|uniref:Uncharacterized protein n=1 Tax=Brassica cretica TaxID=69181 RepID=A0A8S9IEU8_BRACR|nr:hypothetical protein F2Q68_00024540 [Brassica cretica]KAF2604660.1 hypothetical protein F2Q70_00025191 [Brassica cretica]
MLKRCSRHRKEKDGGTETTEVEDLKEGLPERLFATDRFPRERVNMYSAVDLLLAVRGTLNGMPEMGEHDSGVVVQPFLEISGTHEERWGV